MNSTTPISGTYAIPHDEGVMIRKEEFLPHEAITTVLDGEEDVWVRNPETNLYYLAGEDADPDEDADTSLDEILSEYDILDVNVQIPDPDEKPAADTPAFQRGDIVTNYLTGRETLILGHRYMEPLGHLYVVIEKGHVYPAECYPQQPGAALFMESMLVPTGVRMTEAETAMLTVFYTN